MQRTEFGKRKKPVLMNGTSQALSPWVYGVLAAMGLLLFVTLKFDGDRTHRASMADPNTGSVTQSVPISEAPGSPRVPARP